MSDTVDHTSNTLESQKLPGIEFDLNQNSLYERLGIQALRRESLGSTKFLVHGTAAENLFPNIDESLDINRSGIVLDRGIDHAKGHSWFGNLSRIDIGAADGQGGFYSAASCWLIIDNPDLIYLGDSIPPNVLRRTPKAQAHTPLEALKYILVDTDELVDSVGELLDKTDTKIPVMTKGQFSQLLGRNGLLPNETPVKDVIYADIEECKRHIELDDIYSRESLTYLINVVAREDLDAEVRINIFNTLDGLHLIKSTTLNAEIAAFVLKNINDVPRLLLYECILENFIPTGNPILQEYAASLDSTDERVQYIKEYVDAKITLAKLQTAFYYLDVKDKLSDAKNDLDFLERTKDLYDNANSIKEVEKAIAVYKADLQDWEA